MAFYKGLPHNLSKVQRVAFLSDPSVEGIVPVNGETLQLGQTIPVDVYFLTFHGQF
jgi:hypothetical protein